MLVRPADFIIQFNTQPGFIREFDKTVLIQGFVVDDHIVPPARTLEFEFESAEIPHGRAYMGAGYGSDGAAEIVNGDRDIPEIGHIGNLLGLQQPARLHDIRLKDIAGLIDDERLEIIATKKVLSSADGCCGTFRYALVSLDIKGGDGIFQEEHFKILYSVGQANGVVRIVTAVTVHGHLPLPKSILGRCQQLYHKFELRLADTPVDRIAGKDFARCDRIDIDLVEDIVLLRHFLGVVAPG